MSTQEIQNDPNYGYNYSQFKDNIDNSVGGGSDPRGGSLIGITELMDGRVAFLNTQTEFLATQPVISNITSSPTQVTSYEDTWITADVQTAKSVQLAYRYSQTDAFTKIDMVDDGNHHDGASGDGVYGATVSVGSSGIQYYLYAENEEAAAFSPPRAAYEFYTLEAYGNLVINEFLASNDMVVADQDGEFDDWIELYNNSEKDINLTGYYLSDDADDLTQWTFPDTSIAAGGYLIIWADNDEDQSGLHANFKLSASGETIYLTNPNSVVINEITFNSQEADVSTGRYPNGTGSFDEMSPSFSGSNQMDTLVLEENDAILPKQIELQQNYPNPFNPTTAITYSLPNSVRVELAVFNLQGQRVKTLVTGFQSAGTYQAVWDGTNKNGMKVTSGIYIYQMIAGNQRLVKKMSLMK